MTAVSVKNLTVQFGNFKAVNNISFDVNEGEIFGFLGANGAGKTTTIRVICGLQSITSGSVNVMNDSDDLKKHIGYMSQKFTLYNDLSIYENLEFWSTLRNVDHEKLQGNIDDLIKFMQLDVDLKTMVADLPRGIKQRVALMCAIIHNPEIIFLDEPTSGVSNSARKLFWNKILDLKKHGKTIFVTSHYMDEVELCDRLAFMKDGEILDIDTPKNFMEKTSSHNLEDAFIKIVQRGNHE